MVLEKMEEEEEEEEEQDSRGSHARVWRDSGETPRDSCKRRTEHSLAREYLREEETRDAQNFNDVSNARGNRRKAKGT